MIDQNYILETINTLLVKRVHTKSLFLYNFNKTSINVYCHYFKRLDNIITYLMVLI